MDKITKAREIFLKLEAHKICAVTVARRNFEAQARLAEIRR